MNTCNSKPGPRGSASERSQRQGKGSIRKRKCAFCGKRVVEAKLNYHMAHCRLQPRRQDNNAVTTCDEEVRRGKTETTTSDEEVESGGTKDEESTEGGYTGNGDDDDDNTDANDDRSAGCSNEIQEDPRNDDDDDKDDEDDESLGLRGVEDDPLGDDDDNKKWESKPGSPTGTLIKIRPYRNNWFHLDDDGDSSDSSNDESEARWLDPPEDNDDGNEQTEVESTEQNNNGIGAGEQNNLEGGDDSTSALGLVPINAPKVPEIDRIALQEMFGAINNKWLFQPCPRWSSPPSAVLPDLPANCHLRQILNNSMLTMGLCYHILPAKEDPKKLEDKEISMLRLIDLCNMQPKRGRQFVDEFLDMVAEEMQVRGFDPCDKNRPKREALTKKIMKMYGEGLEPTVIHMAVANKDGLINLQEGTLQSKKKKKNKKRSDKPLVGITEDQILQSEAYRTVPQTIDGRKRYMVNVISFNARKMLMDLLEDTTIFGDVGNLVVNYDNPFLPYRNISGISEEILDGTWYSDTIQRLRAYKTDPLKEQLEFVLPIVMYVDKTGTSMNQRYPLEPFIFTTAIIKKSVRNKPTSWRPLGFVPDLETRSSAESRYMNTKNKGSTAQAYHEALGYLLEGMEEIQENGIVHWLQLGSYKKKVRIRPEVACIINDGKSADMLTLRVPSTNWKRRISRCCTTIQQNCDRTSVECQYIELNEEISQLFHTVGLSEKAPQEEPINLEAGQKKPSDEVSQGIIQAAKDRLDELHFNPVRNAFLARCIRFGLDPRNIWGANPVDLMHAFQSGILMYVVKMILDSLPQQKQVLLDQLVHKLFHCLRSNERQDYPRMNFTKGFSKLTMLTSDEWAGKLFVLLVILHTNEGSSVFDSAKTFSKDDIKLPEGWTEQFKDLVTLQEESKCLDGFSVELEKTARPEQVEADRRMEALGYGVPKTEEEEEEMMEKREEILQHIKKERRKKGKEKQKNKITSEGVEAEEMLRKCSSHDFTELAEALLCFHAWYKLGVNKITKEGKVNTSVIRASVARMLSMVRWYMPRKKGNGWKLQKFHDLLHLAVDIERFGPPSNFDAGPQESGLRHWAKLPALTSQMRGYNTFSAQVAARTFEYLCFATALRKNGFKSSRDKNLGIRDSKQKETEEPVVGGTKYRVYNSKPREEDESQPSAGGTNYRLTKAFTKKSAKSHFSVSPVIEDFLRWQPKQDCECIFLQESGGESFWELQTEVSMVIPDTKERVTLRCHPNFRNEGPWYDWVIVRFDTKDTQYQRDTVASRNSFLRNGGKKKDWDPIQGNQQYDDGFVPCKILGIAQNPKNKKDVRLLVHGCQFRTSQIHTRYDTVLLEFWQLAYHNRYADLPAEFRQLRKQELPPNERFQHLVPHLSWITIDNVYSTCLVIEEEPGIHEVAPINKEGEQKNWVMLVRGHGSWPGEFTD